MPKFELSDQMTMVMVQILQKAPFEIVAPILNELQRQADAQRLPQPPQQPNGKPLTAAMDGKPMDERP